MAQPPIENLLKNLASADPREAWTEFLSQYSPTIYQVVRHFETDLDRSSDCFQFVCEHLIKDKARRLRKFKGEGAATFPTWLRAVVRNLCIDWHRKQFGRRRPFRAVSRLSAFDQEVFHVIYERGTPIDDGLTILAAAFPNVTEAAVVQSRERIEKVLTTRQRWLLVNRAVRGDAYASDSEKAEAGVLAISDPRPDPEALAMQKENEERLERVLANLSSKDRMLLRLRFEQDLTLEQIAKILGTGNAQRADRQLKEILARIRRTMFDKLN